MNKMTRRTMLISGSTALMLPILESGAFAKLKSAGPAIPKRLVFLPMGYGVNAENWFPSEKQVGKDYDLPPLLEPFKDLKSDFSILQNLSHRHKAAAHGGTTNWLTSAKVGNGGGNSVSCDQLAAEVLGGQTRYNSLAIGNPGRVDGHGDKAGYASWGRDGKPVGLYRSMEDVYTALFGTGGKSEEVLARLAKQQSSLDVILGNAKRLNNHISASDRHRVDEYFTAIRNVEKRLDKAQVWAKRPYPKAPFDIPRRISGQEQIELMLDLMCIAMQSDSTRVMTYMLPTQLFIRSIGGSNAHRMSHKGAGPLDPNAIHQKRDLVLSNLVAGFLRKLKETKEADGSNLLDHSLVVYGSALRQGHAQINGPTMVAGYGGGKLNQGQNIVYESKVTPLSDLWLSILRHVGVNTNQFGESKRVITEMGFK